jgi:hypothetical protein
MKSVVNINMGIVLVIAVICNTFQILDLNAAQKIYCKALILLILVLPVSKETEPFMR